jgi:putative Holliday junction resolvase
MEPRGRVLGIDFGERRIGLAISDRAARIAFPAGIVESRGRKHDLAALCQLAQEREIARIVVGLPIHLEGHESRGSEAARSFARALEGATGLPVELLDERWTTRAADRSLDESKSGRRRRREAVDSVAATLLLRTFLERPPQEEAHRR